MQNFINKYWIVIIALFNASLDFLHVQMFLLIGENYIVFTRYIQPSIFFISILVFLFLIPKNPIDYWKRTLIVIAICLVSLFLKSYSNMPSSIARCGDGRIEIQKISFTGAGYRYYFGEDENTAKNKWEVMGWVKDKCGIPVKYD